MDKRIVENQRPDDRAKDGIIKFYTRVSLGVEVCDEAGFLLKGNEKYYNVLKTKYFVFDKRNVQEIWNLELESPMKCEIGVPKGFWKLELYGYEMF